MADEILPGDDSEKSPVDNLPVAAGKKRRGRPRKARPASEQVIVPAPEAKEPAEPSGMARKNVVALVKQLVKQHAPAPAAQPQPPDSEKQLTAAVGRRAAAAARRELAASTPLVTDPAVSTVVHERIADEQQQVAAQQRVGSRHGGRFRHLFLSN